MDLAKKKRTANFREDETKLLIQLWGSPTIQDKLSLTHRKAPVMRLLAANMQQRGFFRTSDEIKTRIRNLKCLYHRIKRTMACGTGLGTVDPDWPHYKAMDEIMSKEYPANLNESITKESTNQLDLIQIKQEVEEDVSQQECDDSNLGAKHELVTSESNDDCTKDEEEEESTVISITEEANKPTEGSIQVKKMSSLRESGNSTIPIQPAGKGLSSVLPIQMPNSSSQGSQPSAGQTNALPFPFLILNHLNSPNTSEKEGSNRIPFVINNTEHDSIAALLKDLIELQKQCLDVSKQKLEVEKQRLELDRLFGRQQLTLFLQSECGSGDASTNRIGDLKRKFNQSQDDTNNESNMKILRTLFEPDYLSRLKESDMVPKSPK